MNIQNVVAFALLTVAALTVTARTQDLALWRGETQVFRLQSFAKIGGTPPKGVTMRRGVIAAEKFRILSSAGAIATNDLAKLRKDFDARPAILGKVLYQVAEEEVERILNKEGK